jgi:hypothetical protein
MTALASDLNFFRSRVATGIAAILLALWNGAKARLVSALFLFVCHEKSPLTMM